MINKKRIAPVCLLLVAAFCCVFGAFLLTPKRAEAQVNEAVSISALDGTAGNSGEGYANLLDGKKSAGKKGTDFTKWCVNYTEGNEIYVVFDAAIATTMSGYTLVTGNDNEENTGRNPKDWVLYGCNDYDSTAKSGTWTALHTVVGDTTMQDVNFTSYHFDIPTESQGQYRYYKLVVSAIKDESGSGVFQLCEMSFDYENFITILSETDAVDSAETADKLFDGKKTSDNGSKWCFKMPTSGNAYVIFKTQTPVFVSEYTFVTGNDNSTATGRNPKDWVLYACNDYDEVLGTGTWATLHEVTDDQTLQDEDFTEYSFTIPSENVSRYQYYKLEISANKGGNLVQIGEMELTYSTCNHAWVEGDPTDATCTDPPYKNYTCSTCGATKREANGVANGHAWGTTSEEEATCTEAKKIHQTCSVCKATQTLTEGEANGHAWQVTKQIDANCTSKQHNHYACENCSQTKVEQVGTALGHAFVDGRCVRCGLTDGTTQKTIGDFIVKGGTENVDYKFENGVFKILSSTHLTISNADQTIATTNRIYVEKNISANVTLAGVNINVGVTEGKTYYDDDLQLCAFEIAKDSEGDVIITLAEGSKNFMMSGAYHAGIEKIGESGSLLIDGTGSLEVYGGPYGAGIGSGGRNVPTNYKIANITIKDCEVYAAGSGMKNEDGTCRGVFIHNTTYSTFPAPGIGVGGATSFVGYSASDLNIDGNITLINARVTTYSISCSSIGPVGEGYVNNIKIINSSLKSLYYWDYDGTTYDTSSVLWSYNGQMLSLLIVGGASDGELPKDENGEEVYLLVIENPNGDIVKIDGEYYPIVAHSSTDTNIYAYVTGKTHTVQVGESVYTYTFGDTSKYATNKSVFDKSETVGTAEALKSFSVEAKNSGDTIVLGEDYTYENGILTILTNKEMIISSSGIKTTDKIVINSQGANITLKNVNIDVSLTEDACALEIASTSTGDICIGLLGENTLKSGKNKAGLQNSSSATLTICGSGNLSAYGGENGAGIGGGNGIDGNNITISGAIKVLAIGGKYGTGIGGGYGGNASNIVLSDGVISARGGLGGAGIGAGCSLDAACTASNITISGGTIFVEGGKANIDEDIGAGAGIGSGFGGSASNIVLSGGCVKIVSDAKLIGGTEATSPVNAASEDVFLLTILNADCENVLIDGMSFSPKNLHALGDDNLYVYLTGSDHTIKIGDDETKYHFDATSETFFLCAKSENIAYDVTGHWYSCVDENCGEQFDFCAHTHDQQVATDMYLCTGADCTHKATYYYSCVCGHCGTDTFESGEPLGHDYVWVQIKKGSYEGHFKVCENCNDQILFGGHVYDQKIEADEYFCKGADCTHAKTYYYSCECGHKGTQTFEVGTALGHDYSDDWSFDGTHHYHACTREKCYGIDSATKEEHSYFSGCDDICDVCGYDRSTMYTPVHSITTDWQYNNYQHWHACENCIDESGTLCSHREYAAEHTYSDGRLITINGTHYPICDCCDYYDITRGEACEVITTECGESGHRDVCSVCGEYLTGIASHNYDDECDAICNECGYDRGTSHNISDSWTHDDTYHWKECSNCFGEISATIHTFALKYDNAHHWFECTTCGYKKYESEHGWDDENDATCNGCDYVRKFDVESIKLGVSGYEIDKKIVDIDISLNSSTKGVWWDEDSVDYYNYDEDWWYWWVLTDFDQSTYNYDYVYYDDYGCFMPNTKYWIVVELYPSDGYTFENLTNKDVVLEGVGQAFCLDIYSDYMQAYFRLPLLIGASNQKLMPELKFTLTGLVEGGLVSDLSVVSDGNTVEPNQYVISRYKDGNYVSDDDTTTLLDKTSKYEFDIWFDAAEGYTFNGYTSDMISISGLGSLMYFYVSEGGGYIGLYYAVPSLDEDHEHVWGSYYIDYDNGTHYRYCDGCYEFVEEEHVYDDEFDTTCDLCGYVRTLFIDSMEFELSGYELGGLVENATLTPTTTAGFGGQDWAVLNGKDDAIYDGDKSYFSSEVEYWIVVMFASSSGYKFGSLTEQSVTLKDYGAAQEIIVANDHGIDFCIAYFKLPRLSGTSTISTIGEQNFVISDYAAGTLVKDVGMTRVGDGVESFTYNICIEGDYSSPGDYYQLKADERYCVEIKIVAESGYTMFGLCEDDITFDDGTLVEFNISSGGSYVELRFELTSLYGEHEHDFSETYSCDATHHWLECSLCGDKKDKEEHDFDDDDDATCNTCGYVRTLQILSLNFTMTGYEFGATVADLELSTSQNLRNWRNDYGNCFAICTSSTCMLGSFNSAIDPDDAQYYVFDDTMDYYLAIILEAESGYTLTNLTKDNILLNEKISANALLSNNYVYAIFKLPTLQAPHIHYGTWVDEVPATCATTGVKAHYTCESCGKHFDAENNEIPDIVIAINADAHQFGAWAQEVSATCCEVGTKGHKDCLLCHKHFDENENEITDLVIAIDEHAHSFGQWVKEIPATCSQVGTKGHKTCAHCGKHFDENENEITDLVIAIDEHAHSFGQWTKEIPATTESEGAKAHKDCSNCSKHFDEDGVEIVDLSIQKLDATLSGGAIAGIVIACVVALNCGAFALVWFVIKKKKFADLAKIIRKR